MTGLQGQCFSTVLDKCVSVSEHCSARPITFFVGWVPAAWLDTAS